RTVVEGDEVVGVLEDAEDAVLPLSDRPERIAPVLPIIGRYRRGEVDQAAVGGVSADLLRGDPDDVRGEVRCQARDEPLVEGARGHLHRDGWPPAVLDEAVGYRHVQLSI